MEELLHNTEDQIPKEVTYVPEYPNNSESENQFNFLGFYDLNANKNWAYDYDFNHDINPITRLSVRWGKKEEDITTSNLDVMFASSQFAYAKELTKGKTVSENLNQDENINWSDIDKPLHRFTDGVITMRLFMHATIGGYVVEDFVLDDALNKTSFSAVLLRNPSNQYIIAYRGTNPEWNTITDGVLTDIFMGIGILNSQLDDALAFYDKMYEKYYDNQSLDKPFVTGHSLGGALSAHVAILRNTHSITVNSAEGYSIPITIRNNMNTFLYSGYELLKLHSYENPFDIGTLKTYNERIGVTFLEDEFSDPLNNHLIHRLITYNAGTGDFGVANPDYVTTDTSENGKLSFKLGYNGNIPLYLGSVKNDLFIGNTHKVSSIFPYVFCGDGNDRISYLVNPDLIGGNGDDTFTNITNGIYRYHKRQSGHDTILNMRGNVNMIYLYNIDVLRETVSNGYVHLTLTDGQSIQYRLEATSSKPVIVVFDANGKFKFIK
jgi:hypothetical protein